MSYDRYVEELSPTFHLPLDYVDFDGKIEDTVLFNLSEETDAEVLFESGIVNVERSVGVNDPITFEEMLGTVESFSVVLGTAGEEDQNIIEFDDDSLGIDTVSVPGSWNSAVTFWYEPEDIDHAFTVAIDSYTSPAIPAGVWVSIIYNGTWHIDVLGPGPGVLAAQQFQSLDYQLSGDEVADLRNLARLGYTERQILDAEGLTISDQGAEGLAANWHIVAV